MSIQQTFSFLRLGGGFKRLQDSRSKVGALGYRACDLGPGALRAALPTRPHRRALRFACARVPTLANRRDAARLCRFVGQHQGTRTTRRPRPYGDRPTKSSGSRRSFPTICGRSSSDVRPVPKALIESALLRGRGDECVVISLMRMPAPHGRSLGPRTLRTGRSAMVSPWNVLCSWPGGWVRRLPRLQPLPLRP